MENLWAGRDLYSLEQLQHLVMAKISKSSCGPPRWDTPLMRWQRSFQIRIIRGFSPLQALAHDCMTTPGVALSTPWRNAAKKNLDRLIRVDWE
jgi:hypothetical protein